MLAVSRLSDMLASDEVARRSYASGRILVYADATSGEVDLSVTDTDCGENVKLMLDRIAAAEEHTKKREAHEKTIKALAPRLHMRPATPLPDGRFEISIPEVDGERAWAKRVDRIDVEGKDGYAFIGDFIRAGQSEVLDNGQLVLCGNKSWTGSRKRGEYVYSKELYLVTPAGLRSIAEGNTCKSEAIKYLALSVSERIKKCLTRLRKSCVERIVDLKSLDPVECQSASALLNERLAEQEAMVATIDQALTVTPTTKPQMQKADLATAIEKATDRCWVALEELPERSRRKVLSALKLKLAPAVPDAPAVSEELATEVSVMAEEA